MVSLMPVSVILASLLAVYPGHRAAGEHVCDALRAR
jgi:hypothetical protein